MKNKLLAINEQKTTVNYKINKNKQKNFYFVFKLLKDMKNHLPNRIIMKINYCTKC